MGLSLIAANVGLAALAVSLVLAFRSRRLARISGGLSRQFALHHGVALAGLLLVALHVGLELWSLAEVSASLLVDPATWAEPGMLAGLGAALGFVALLVGARLDSLAKRPWLRVHRLGLVLMGVALVHGALFLYGSDGWAPLRWAVLCFGGMASGLALLGFFWVPSQKLWRVQRLVDLGSDLFELVLAPDVHAPDVHAPGVREQGEARPVSGAECACGFPAGSIVYVRFLGPAFTRAWHPLSVASCRRENAMRLVIRACGRDTHQVMGLRSGDSVAVRGPFGDWRLGVPAGSSEVWLAAGVGIAPFVGLLHCVPTVPFGPVCLVHFDRNPRESQLIQELCEGLCKQENPSGGAMPCPLSVRAAFAGGEHHDEGQVIRALAAEFPTACFFVCGPPKFLRLARNTLRRCGIKTSRIVS